LFHFQDNYLSESGVYPLIVVLGVAVSFGSYMMVHKLSSNPDIRINKKERGVIIRE
jgi:ABC-type lipoprotein release transport system permease subunit